MYELTFLFLYTVLFIKVNLTNMGAQEMTVQETWTREVWQKVVTVPDCKS
jgi:hypothetical protein